jgi:hypothetical protein
MPEPRFDPRLSSPKRFIFAQRKPSIGLYANHRDGYALSYFGDGSARLRLRAFRLSRAKSVGPEATSSAIPAPFNRRAPVATPIRSTSTSSSF